jgi:hypothetical protein
MGMAFPGIPIFANIELTSKTQITIVCATM